jgi:aminoglycoside/choline kinase family phosphotransferase
LAKGYSAPQIYGEDPACGFLLLEDLGDALFARMVSRDATDEARLYHAATDFLVDLHRHHPPVFLARADGRALADLVALTPEWYLRGVEDCANAASAKVVTLIASLFDHLAVAPPVVSLRDFHAENLIWLDGRQGVAQVGLLDFQDAFATHPAYDLASLLQDARRDVSVDLEADCLARYMAATGAQQAPFLAVYALLGAQRALRILGVFARLSLRDGKPRYLEFVPRVWGYLGRNLAHPALAELADAVADGLPAPTPDRLERIAKKCGQYRNH